MKEFRVVKAIIEKNGKYLLIKSKSYEGDYWEVPGGRLEDSESFEDALKREVREEVGLEVDIVRELNSWRVDVSSRDMVLNGRTYLCSYVSGEVALSDEQIKYEWVNKGEFSNKNISDWLKAGIGLL